MTKKFGIALRKRHDRHCTRRKRYCANQSHPISIEPAFKFACVGRAIAEHKSCDVVPWEEQFVAAAIVADVVVIVSVLAAFLRSFVSSLLLLPELS